MSILITGGAGYIGGTVSRYLLEKGEEVVILDNLAKSKREAVDKRAVFYQGDVADSKLVSDIVIKHKIEECIHFAAFIEVGESVNEPCKYFENNTGKAIVLFNTLKNGGVKKIVFSSTAAVYGEPEYVPIDEEHPKKPSNPYGMSKLFTESVLDCLDKSDSVRHVALRYFNACGAFVRGEDHNPETHLIPLILQVPLGRREFISVYGDDYPTSDGTCVRDYIHVQDLASAHYLALVYLRKGGGSVKINLGNGRGFSVKEVIDAARKVTGHPIPAKIAERRSGDPSVLIASSAKAEKILGWKQEQPSIDEMVKSAWEWHKSYHGMLEKK